MIRSYSTKNLLDKKAKRRVSFVSTTLREAIGAAQRKGCWLVYGPEKNGKTWVSIKIASDLAHHDSVWYISAEEGVDESFTEAIKRAGVTASVKMRWNEYIPMEVIIEELRSGSKKRVGIVVIDNLTAFSNEIKPNKLMKGLINEFPDKLFILLAHEDKGEPSGALARMASKMAKVIIHVKGLSAFVTSRYSPGGRLVIDEGKSELFWGTDND